MAEACFSVEENFDLQVKNAIFASMGALFLTPQQEFLRRRKTILILITSLQKGTIDEPLSRTS
jgi:hypothetical protein